MSCEGVCHACDAKRVSENSDASFDVIVPLLREEDGSLRCSVCDGDFVELLDRDDNQQPPIEPTPQLQASLSSSDFEQLPSTNVATERNERSTTPPLAENRRSPLSSAPTLFASLASFIDDTVDALIVHPLNQLSLSTRPPAAAKSFRSVFRDEDTVHFSLIINCRAPPASRQYVTSLKQTQMSSAQLVDEPACLICCEDFQVDSSEFIVQLACTHHFHRDCVLPWLESTSTCPTCRWQLPTDNPAWGQCYLQCLNLC